MNFTVKKFVLIAQAPYLLSWAAFVAEEGGSRTARHPQRLVGNHLLHECTTYSGCGRDRTEEEVEEDTIV